MALYFPDQRALYLHAPKCAGYWVKAACKAAGINCRPPVLLPGVSGTHPLREHVLEPVDYCFTTIRDIPGWYESWWKFMAGQWQIWEPGLWHPCREIEHIQEDDFGTFVRRICEECPGAVGRMLGLYEDGADYVGWHSSLPGSLLAGLRGAGVRDYDEEALMGHPWVNVSQALRGRPGWTGNLLDLVRETEGEAMRSHA